jgi:cell division septal protein FtsQ
MKSLFKQEERLPSILRPVAWIKTVPLRLALMLLYTLLFPVIVVFGVMAPLIILVGPVKLTYKKR